MTCVATRLAVSDVTTRLVVGGGGARVPPPASDPPCLLLNNFLTPMDTFARSCTPYNRVPKGGETQ
jgi:hypothetical protein